jgi:hypothetical protein
MSDVGGRCPAIPGFCTEAWQCKNCALQYACLKRKTNEARPLRNKKCFRCMHLVPMTMGVACGIKKDH